MKILFALLSAGSFIFYDEVARRLCSQGHSVRIWHGRSIKASLSNRALLAAQRETGNCTSGILRAAALSWVLSDIREARGSGIYNRANHPSPWLGRRRDKYFSIPLRLLLKINPFRKLLLGQSSQLLFNRWEARLVPDRAITRELLSLEPDIIVASPYIYGRPLEVDYVKAAKALNIPTIVVVQSWDNLTTKGTFYVLPDVLIVWNQPLADEAVEIHNVPRERILITGAPRFDAWFATQPSCTRAEFCHKVGFDPDQEYVTYLCSSNSIAGDETAFVSDFARALLNHSGTRNLKVLVRPYPSNASIWEGVSVENIVIWPPCGDIPDTPEARSNFFDSLYFSLAAFGVNTTAFLEAAISDKPCVTAITEHYRRTQVESAHFKHLLRADFIEIARGFDQVANLLTAIQSGADSKAGNRRRFVREFIRPYGLDVPAANLMAQVIEGFAQRKPLGVLRDELINISSLDKA